MTRFTLAGAALALVFSATASAQRGAEPAFTATGESCEDVTWSEEALERYPNIESACRDVMERDGNYYVRFEGVVRRVADRGNRITIDFEGGDTLTLRPPENLSLTIDGRQRSPRDLLPGDELTFYVPQDQLTATFFAGQPETAEPQEVEIEEEEITLAQADDIETEEPELPRTAGFLPFFGVGGIVLTSFGALMTLRRRLRLSNPR